MELEGQNRQYVQNAAPVFNVWGQQAQDQQLRDQIHDQNVVQMPIMQNMVRQDQVKEADEGEIQIDKLREAWTEAGLELSESEKKRNAELSRSLTRRSLSRRLKQGNPVINGRIGPGLPEDVLKLRKKTDAAIVSEVEKRGIANKYVEARCSLIKNRYYTMLPESVKTLGRDELMKRLRDLYKAEAGTRNKELILYYQTLVRIRDMEEDAASGQDQEEILRPVSITGDELKENQNRLERNLKVVNKAFLTEEQKADHIAVMRKVMGMDPDDPLPEGSEGWMSAEKKEGIRRILAWMYRNCCKTGESKEPAVYRLALLRNSEPDKLLYMFYLVEKGRVESPGPMDYIAANDRYVPDLDAFKGKVVASRWKFWKRLPWNDSDDVIDWRTIGAASRVATKQELPVRDEYREAWIKERQAQQELTRDNGGLTDVEKRDALLDLVVARGSLLMTLYKSVGLHPDMPVELIGDKAVKQRALGLLAGISDSLKELVSVNSRLPKEQQTKGHGGIPGNKEYKEGGEDDSSEDGLETMGDITNGLYLTLGADGIITSLGNLSEAFRGTKAYTGVFSGMTGIAGILGLIGAVCGAIDVSKSAPFLTTADHISRGFGTAGDVMISVSDAVSGVKDAVESLAGLAEKGAETGGYLGETTIKSIGESFATASDGIGFVSGCLAMAAGAVMLTSGAISHVRASSSQKDLERAKQRLEERDRREEKAQVKFDEDAEALRDFMKHQDRALTDQKVSSTIQMVTGAIYMAGGFLSATGILAPLGGILSLVGTVSCIGMGVFYARRRKNLTWKSAVDDALKLDDLVQFARENDSTNALIDMKDEEVRNIIRQEALSELGYFTYKEMFADLMKKNADLLYRRVFEKKPEDDPDWEMYHSALLSVGLKVKYPVHEGDSPIPTREMIYNRLME